MLNLFINTTVDVFYVNVKESNRLCVCVERVREVDVLARLSHLELEFLCVWSLVCASL